MDEPRRTNLVRTNLDVRTLGRPVSRAAQCCAKDKHLYTLLTSSFHHVRGEASQRGLTLSTAFNRLKDSEHLQVPQLWLTAFM